MELEVIGRRLCDGFTRGVIVLREAGCSTVYLDGSFVTSKEFPGDYDACWEIDGVNVANLDPVLKDFSNRRVAQKTKFGGEFFPAQARAEESSPFRTFFDFFQIDKETGVPKGIVGIKLI
jgi:hypothetical protein